MGRSICFYTDSGVLGGAERSLFALIGSLDRDRWHPTLLLEEKNGVEDLAAEAEARDVPVRPIPPMSLGVVGARRVPGLARSLREEAPDVFNAHLSGPLSAKFGLAAALMARIPAVVATVQLVPDFRLERSSFLQLRALSVGIDRYIAVSHDVAALLADRFHWPREKIDVVYNGIPVTRFGHEAPPDLRRDLLGDREHLVLTCARLDPQKGLHDLLRAAAEVPEARFAIAGEGPLQPSLEAEAARLGLGDQVLFLGQRDDIPDLLAACDVFALPSLYEGSSLALLEAMAARRAVVSSAIGGTLELVDDGESGLLVEPHDSGALAAALRRLLADPELRAALGRRGRQRVERDFTVEGMAARVTEIYEDLLDGDGRSRG